MQTTFDFPELLRLIEDRSAALRAAAASAPDFEAPLPACPGWTLREVVRRRTQLPAHRERPEHGGATTPQNPHALRRRHHRLKTAGTWQAERQGEGETVWSAPTGHRYLTAAEAYPA